MTIFYQKASIAQHKHNLHCVEFRNKANNAYSLFRPQEFLSIRALQRRNIQAVEMDSLDLPISKHYIDSILHLGIQIQNHSKWLNSVAIYTNDTTILNKISSFPFVKKVYPLGKFRTISQYELKDKFVTRTKRNKIPYGQAANQIYMLSGQFLHKQQHKGKNIHIAVLDGGFINVYRSPFFDSLRINGRLLGTHDFVEGDGYVYEHSTHGSNVLSCMAANSPGLMIGTAPDAAYYLFTTEDVKGEYPAEEFNWVAALEYADSLGVDIINSSLGYTSFHDKQMSYSRQDLDGKTAISSRGANIAASKGLLVVNSAGNEGDGKWHYIGCPADAWGSLSIGAVDPYGEKADFSSWGPTFDGRLKPEICAQGVSTVVASTSKHDVSYSNGTSFSAPVMAGMIASLKSAHPKTNNNELIENIKMSASNAMNPDTAIGYGIPNFLWAHILSCNNWILLNFEEEHLFQVDDQREDIKLFVAPFKGIATLQLIDTWGNIVDQFVVENKEMNVLEKTIHTDKYKKGLYQLLIKLGTSNSYIKIGR